MRFPLRHPALAAALFLGGCGGCDQRPRDVLHLAELYAPPPALLELADCGRAFEQRFAIAADAWVAEKPEGLWRAPAPWYDLPLPVLAGERARLVLEGDMALRPAGQGAGHPEEAGTFAVLTLADGDHVFARLGAGARPGAGTIDALVSAGERGAAGRWRLAAGPLVGDGFLVRADAAAALTLDVPPDAQLRFDTACVGQEAATATLRVTLDGEPLAEIDVRASAEHELVAHEIALPADGRDGARLALELEGDAWCGVYGPRIVPADPGESARPDIVLFLADTFRADNIAFYGGEPGITPELDAFAEESLRAARVWAPSCWTLPSHASMFLGVQPLQHGAVDPQRTPAGGLVSVAEKLRDAGYRTVAVTDSLFVSRRFDLDRGFEHFEEHGRGGGDREVDLERTLRRAREVAARGDGRPLFLFVHTYRTHEPYQATAATRAELGERLGIGPTWDELKNALFAELLARHEAGDTDARRLMEQGDLHELLVELGLLDPDRPEGDAFLRSVRALYRGGARDLDRAFGRFLADLDARGRPAYVVFTSDHGEAFGEHESIFHGHGVWEENLRIPLLIRGPGLEPRTLAYPASLVDLPQTLAEIAGIAPHPVWNGTSLLSLDEHRPILAFDCAQRGDSSGAVFADGLKVTFAPTADAVRAARVKHAFDLDTDPREREDLGAVPRARSVLERLAEEVLESMRPLAKPGTADLSEAHLDQMRDMGYTSAED
jgi:arylsulfatase A-like enzyme